MSGKITVQIAVKALKAAGASMRCSEITSMLEALGFVVKDGKKGGHKLYFHDGLADFSSSSYNCEHGKNPEIKRAYIKKVLKVLEAHEAELSELMREKEND